MTRRNHGFVRTNWGAGSLHRVTEAPVAQLFRGRRFRVRESVRLSGTRFGVRRALALVGVFLATGCEDPVPPPLPTSITIVPATAHLESFAETVQLAATVHDQHGKAMSGVSVTWTTGAAGVATVSGSGLVTAAGNGEATIEAAAGAVVGTAQVTMRQRPAAAEVTPDVDTLVALGDTVRLAAEAADANGHPIEGAVFAWSSGDEAVATVDSAGVVTATGNGEATIEAAAGAAVGTAQVTMRQRPAAVEVTPDVDTLVALGETVRLAAEAADANGHPIEGAVFAWSSGDEAVATVDSAGVVTATGNGTATVTARADGASGSAMATVIQVADSVLVSPPARMFGVGDTLRLTAEAIDANGHAVGGTTFAWTSSDVSVASVDYSGFVRGLAEGRATITAAAGDARGRAEIAVVEPDRAALAAFYEVTNGAKWSRDHNWLTDAPLEEWHGVSTDTEGRVTRLELSHNGIRGPVPPELGRLANLVSVDLSYNAVTAIPPELGDLANLEGLDLTFNIVAAIPPELGHLVNLEALHLSHNALTGPIPPELGHLVNLEALHLSRNALTGPIPPELGHLVNLETLNLSSNALTGPIPPELGDPANLERLVLEDNTLTGPIPPELGRLAHLEALNLSDNDLTGPIPPELGDPANLNLKGLSLGFNRLTGPIPAELGNLANLERLYLPNNALTGLIPPALGKLDEIVSVTFDNNDGLCLPGTPAFRHWFREDGTSSVALGPLCNGPDVKVLRMLYESTGGDNWAEADGWLGRPIPGDWKGVTADSLGRVRELDLAGNGLDGELYSSLAELAEAVALRLDANSDLAGRLPLALTRLRLKVFHYDGTGLCTPPDDAFGRWLESIPDHEGTGVDCESLGDREVLAKLYRVTGGASWARNTNWLSDAPLEDWYGVSTDTEGRVTGLDLSNNELTGPIPVELGDIESLQYLGLYGNALTGLIPPELGNLANLEYLYLQENALTGPILPELGDLAKLEYLYLQKNALTGPIPPELGDLAKLEYLSLRENGLTGPIPPELGDLANLYYLYLSDNALTGPIPPEFGELTDLSRLYLNDNPELAGALPDTMTALTRLEHLMAGDTGLCAPLDNPKVRAWIKGIPNNRIRSCTPAAAYLTQAVQTRHDHETVFLVAGDEALLRVFLVAAKETDEHIPDVRARFYLDGREAKVIDVPGKSTAIPTEVEEGDLAKSVNAKVPGEIVKQGLEAVIEVDSVDASLGVARRIPAEGRVEVPVRTMPELDLTLIPFLYSGDPDSSIITVIEDIADDPGDHEKLDRTRTLLPVDALDVTAHEPVTISSTSGYSVLSATQAIWVAEGRSGHYMGMMPRFSDVGGVAHWPGRTSASVPSSYLMAHELGHNMSLGHAPCGARTHLDPLFPDDRGYIGSWGYDFATKRVVPPDRPDLMSYCGPVWVSGYHFNKALHHRLADEGGESSRAPAPARSLLLWGGTGPDGRLRLEPAFIVDAPPALPAGGGDHRLRGLDAVGGELFSLRFRMPELADAGGRSAFAFVLPADPGWAGRLASITLSGPGGAATTLDSRTRRPSALVRNPATGQVRALILDLPRAIATPEDAAALLSTGPSLELRFSRGIPGASAWRR